MSMRIRIIGGIFGLLAGLVLLLNFQTITQEQDQLQEVRLRALAFQEGRLFADRLQNILNQNLAYAEFFKVLLQEDPDMPLEELEAYASYVLEQKQGIASISLAPGGVVTTIFPLAGNEAAIGHDLLNDPERSQYAKEAMERRVPVSQGPVEALQGGLRIFNRSAIYVEKDTGIEFWGFSVIMMDFDALLAESDLLSRRDGFRFALKVEGKGGGKRTSSGGAGRFSRRRPKYWRWPSPTSHGPWEFSQRRAGAFRGILFCASPLYITSFWPGLWSWHTKSLFCSS